MVPEGTLPAPNEAGRLNQPTCGPMHWAQQPPPRGLLEAIQATTMNGEAHTTEQEQEHRGGNRCRRWVGLVMGLPWACSLRVLQQHPQLFFGRHAANVCLWGGHSLPLSFSLDPSSALSHRNCIAELLELMPIQPRVTRDFTHVTC